MNTNTFLCGVIEGMSCLFALSTIGFTLSACCCALKMDNIDCYYGRPWSFSQRKTLFEYCLRFGFNTYVYAPKDDAKHRSRWRDLYTHEELHELSQLIHTAKQLGINFVYALAPGLDMGYSSEKDLIALKRKFDQLSNIGCEQWALLFDDIENEMSQQDKNTFPTFAHAHVAVTNQVYEYLNKPDIFIFCPTVYCSRMAKPSLEKSDYLQTIGDGLHPEINVFWTGPKVVSRQITVPHISTVNNILKRRVLIWDNLNANDYDQRRLYMGPFSGRSLELSSHLSGFLTNPNCEFELNFIPLNTLAQWFHAMKVNEKSDRFEDDDNGNDDSNDNDDDDDGDDDIKPSEIYHVDKAFHQALVDWLPEFHKVKAANDAQHYIKIDYSPQAMSPKPTVSLLVNDEDSQDSINDNQISSRSSSKTHIMECDANAISNDLTVDDVRLLVELFYLPYEHGPHAQQMFLDFYWLRFNYNLNENLNEWRCRALVFHNNAKNISRLLQKLVAIHNRALLYDVYNYINDINSTIVLCSKYLYWIDDDRKRSSVFMSGDVEPWSKRGGLAGEYLDLLPLGDFQSLIRSELSLQTNTFFIRPMVSSDQASMYALCTTICYQEDNDELLNQHSEILADKIIGGYLSSSLNNSDLCLVVENNEDNLCGFALTMNESERYDKFVQVKWIEQMYQKYPNVDPNFFELIECPQWVYDRYSVRIQLFIDSSIKASHMYYLGNKLMKIIMKNISQRGCHACHALVDERNVSLHHLYLYLGFAKIPSINQNDHMTLLGKQF